jgi:hypothetical protein
VDALVPSPIAAPLFRAREWRFDISGAEAARSIADSLVTGSASGSRWHWDWTDPRNAFRITREVPFEDAEPRRHRVVLDGRIAEMPGGCLVRVEFVTVRAADAARRSFWELWSHTLLFVLFTLPWVPSWLRGDIGVEFAFFAAGAVAATVLILRGPTRATALESLRLVHAAIAQHCVAQHDVGAFRRPLHR